MVWPEGVNFAVLIIEIKGEVTEVRGNRGIGSAYVGDKLDRIIGKLPRQACNLPALFADETIHVRKEFQHIITDALAFEDEIRQALFNSRWATDEELIAKGKIDEVRKKKKSK
jgi:hypothetical protein